VTALTPVKWRIVMVFSSKSKGKGQKAKDS
jgi:hypothetical protein